MASVSGDGSTEILTLQDPELYSLIDNGASTTSQFLSLQIKKCDKQTSAIACADFGEDEQFLIDYLSKHLVTVISAFNYIDYDEIDPFLGPLKYGTQWISVVEGKELLIPNKISKNRFSFVEHRVELQDSLIQILIESEKFSFLNLDAGSLTNGKFPMIDNAFFEYVFDLS